MRKEKKINVELIKQGYRKPGFINLSYAMDPLRGW
jgi:hypothetical protein